MGRCRTAHAHKRQFSAEPLEHRTLLAADPAVALIADINPWGDSRPLQFLRAGNAVFFTADDGQHGRELWKTDGTTVGTVLVKDIAPSPGDSDIRLLGAAGGKMIFHVRNGTGRALWVSDGTTDGTVLLREFGAINQAQTLGGEVFFNAGLPDDGIWKTDGTVEGTQLVKSVSSWWDVSFLHRIGESLYFTHSTPEYGKEMWISDGTTAGTRLFVDLDPGPAGSNPGQPFQSAGGMLVHLNWMRLVSTDGTAQGSQLLREAPGMQSFTEVGDRVFFVNHIDWSLWTTDGTPAGTARLTDDAIGGVLGSAGGLLYSVTTGPDGIELWASDGTATGTRLVKPLNQTGMPGVLDINGLAYIDTYDAAGNMTLWRSDGTTAGTTPVAVFAAGSWPLGVQPVYTVMPDGLLLGAVRDGAGNELYRLTFPSNLAPMASAGGPYAVTEGQSLVLDASASTDADGDQLVYHWDINGDGVFGDAMGVSPLLTPERLVELGISPGILYTVRVRASDQSSAVVSAPVTLLVASSTELSIDLLLDGWNRTYRTLAFQLHVNRSDQEITNFIVDWGDGNTTVVPAALFGGSTVLHDGTVPYLFTHQYPGRGQYIITATIEGPAGVLAVTRLVRQPLDATPPTIDVAAPPVAAEDTPLTLVATLADPDGGGLEELIVNWGDGTEQVMLRPSAMVTLSHIYANPGAYTITLNVLDVNGDRATRRLKIDIIERRPKLTFAGKALARPAKPFVLRLRPDPLADDRVLYWTIAWGDGTFQDVKGDATAVSHRYARSGRYRIAVSATDRTGTYRATPPGQPRSAGLVVAVNRRTPRPTLVAPNAAVPGQNIRFSGRTNDGSAAGYLVAWDFGDGRKARPVFAPLTQRLLAPSHAYAQPGVYTARMWIKNAAGKMGSAKTIVRVAPVVIQEQPDKPGETALVIGGTAANDVIRFIHRWGGVEAVLNGRSFGVFHVDRVIAFGGKGDDVITVDDLVGLPAELDGGDGTNRLHAGSVVP